MDSNKPANQSQDSGESRIRTRGLGILARILAASIIREQREAGKLSESTATDDEHDSSWPNT